MREANIVSGNIRSTETVDGEDSDEISECQLLLEDSCSGIRFSTLEAHTEWNTEPSCSLNDSESEEVLNAINPNEVYTSAPVQESQSQSDSMPSDDLQSDGTHQQNLQTAAVYQVVYDISSLGAVMAEPGPPHMDTISIELDEWSSHMLLTDSCVVNELVSSVKMDTQQMHNPDSFMVYPELHLTEEEQKLLDQEGISLPNNLPLTKTEERMLKKVRRKIRNKLSAQDSRRRKKEYIDGLESRVMACSAQNKELQRTVEQLEKHNLSLVAQLRKLQALIKRTATKAAQTSTCIMILIFSLGLIIFPSYSPFRWRSAEDSYAPSGVISRNILNDVSSLPLLEDVGGDEPIISEPVSFTAARKRTDAVDLLSDASQPLDNAAQGSSLEQLAHKNETAVTKANTNSPPVNLIAPVGAGNARTDVAKPPHADEM